MKKFYFGLLAALYSTMALAQEGAADINVDIDKDGGEWYTSPWVWIIIALVFILLLVALTRGRRD